MGTYEQAHKDAADRQGVTAIADALAVGGVAVTVEQTGGFVMAAVTYTPTWAYVITDEGFYQAGRNAYPEWVLCTYTRHAWTTGKDPVSTDSFKSLDRAVTTVKDLIADADEDVESLVTSDAPLEVGRYVTGTTTGRYRSGEVAYRSTWDGVYLGTQDPDPTDPFCDEDGTPVGDEETTHQFRDGHINGIAQERHGFPVSQYTTEA